MKQDSNTIYFFRHGEGMDDIRKEFGGWSDPELSPRGKFIAKKIAKEFLTKNIKFDIILTSPLKRAKQSAQIISKILKVKLEEYIYLKERNTYGILGGLSKRIARENYPELISSYNAQEYIPGAERYEDFKNRIDTLLTKLLKLSYRNVLCITHGFLITTIMEEFLGLTREQIKDGCYLGLKVKNNKFRYLESKGLTFGKGNITYDTERYTKFKKL